MNLKSINEQIKTNNSAIIDYKKRNDNLLKIKKGILDISKIYNNVHYYHDGSFLCFDKLFFDNNNIEYEINTTTSYDFDYKDFEDGIELKLFVNKKINNNIYKIYYNDFHNYEVIYSLKINKNFNILFKIKDESLREEILKKVCKLYLKELISNNLLNKFCSKNKKNKNFKYFQKYINIL